MAYDVTLMPGDGIGPEVVEATRRVLEATGIAFNWDYQDLGLCAQEKHGTTLPEATLDSVRRTKLGLKGPTTTPVGTGTRSVNVGLRQALNLYANLRPAKTYQGVRAPFDDVDLIIVRENLEDLYAGIEFDTATPEAARVIGAINQESAKKVEPDAAISIKMITPEGSRRIVTFAFEYARANKRRLVTAVHKANIMKYTDGLFLHVAQEVAKDYPDISFNDRIVDNMCMQLVQKPDLYDVLVLPNLYGDIISDLCAGMVGGLGVAPGANIGADGAVFEPIHGSAPKYAGQNVANPTAEILTAALMLRHLRETDAAERVEGAVARVIAEGKDVTYDLKPNRDDPTAVGTDKMADAVIAAMG
ncbi:MAG TPA: isocitrate/isopropylmalate dehydrogenase family protein [Thermomicrobiales bacterium]|nr:isocitrate/isopropylmalate dehydrogenase family protein [Thermomicrobiales bacterium]